MTEEKDPTGKSPTDPGAKLDAGKAPIRQGVIEYFPRALIEVARVSEFGAKKYSWGGWGPVENGIERYGNACDRHAVKAAIEGLWDPDSGLLHAAHEAWNALARLELVLRNMEVRQAPELSPEAQTLWIDINEPDAWIRSDRYEFPAAAVHLMCPFHQTRRPSLFARVWSHDAEPCVTDGDWQCVECCRSGSVHLPSREERGFENYAVGASGIKTPLFIGIKVSLRDLEAK